VANLWDDGQLAPERVNANAGNICAADAEGALHSVNQPKERQQEATFACQETHKYKVRRRCEDCHVHAVADGEAQGGGDCIRVYVCMCVCVCVCVCACALKVCFNQFNA
jgi:hypothetical protein